VLADFVEDLDVRVVGADLAREEVLHEALFEALETVTVVSLRPNLLGM
jgi:hypothetical protein